MGTYTSTVSVELEDKGGGSSPKAGVAGGVALLGTEPRSFAKVTDSTLEGKLPLQLGNCVFPICHLYTKVTDKLHLIGNSERKHIIHICPWT